MSDLTLNAIKPHIQQFASSIADAQRDVDWGKGFRTGRKPQSLDAVREEVHAARALEQAKKYVQDHGGELDVSIRNAPKLNDPDVRRALECEYLALKSEKMGASYRQSLEGEAVGMKDYNSFAQVAKSVTKSVGALEEPYLGKLHSAICLELLRATKGGGPTEYGRDLETNAYLAIQAARHARSSGKFDFEASVATALKEQSPNENNRQAVASRLDAAIQIMGRMSYPRRGQPADVAPLKALAEAISQWPKEELGKVGGLLYQRPAGHAFAVPENCDSADLLAFLRHQLNDQPAWKQFAEANPKAVAAIESL